MKVNKLEVHFDALPYHVNLMATDDIFACRNGLLHSLGPADITDKAIAMHCSTGKDGASFVIVKYGASAGVIAHECWHAVHAMLKYVGADLDNEIVAYYLDHLVDKAYALANPQPPLFEQ